MSSSLLIILLVVVWLFVLAPMFIRTHEPIRRTSSTLSQTRTLHSGGGRRLIPQRTRNLDRDEDEDDDAPDEDFELFGVPSSSGSTAWDLWIERREDEIAREDAEYEAELEQQRIEAELEQQHIEAELEQQRIEAERIAAERDEAERLKNAADAMNDVDIATARDSEMNGNTSSVERIVIRSTFGDDDSVGAFAGASVDGQARLQHGEQWDDEASAASQPSDRQNSYADSRDTVVVDGEVVDRHRGADSARSGVDVVTDEDLGDQPRGRDRGERHAARRAEASAYRDAAARRYALSDADIDFAARRKGRGSYDPLADRQAASERYRARQRTAFILVSVTAVFAVLAAIAASALWWVSGFGAVLLVAYMIYLRRQVQMEQALRHRRVERMKRARLGVESREDPELSIVPPRLRRPGAILVETDDEDPLFEHLDQHPGVEYFEDEDRFPVGAGQDERRHYGGGAVTTAPPRRAVG